MRPFLERMAGFRVSARFPIVSLLQQAKRLLPSFTYDRAMNLIVRWASRQNARHVALGTIQKEVGNVGGARLMTKVLVNDMMLSPCKSAG